MRLFLSVLLLAASFSIHARSAVSSGLKVHNGELDLSGWDFRRKPVVPLRGRWAFFPGVHSGEGPKGVSPRFLDPGYFWFWKYSSNPSEGYGTFRLSVRGIPRGLPVLAIDMGMVFSAWRLSTGGGAVVSRGFDPVDIARCRFRIKPEIIPLHLEDGKSSIVLQVAWKARTGDGKPAGFLFGTVRALARRAGHRFALKGFFTGFLALFGLYHLGIFLFQRRYRAFLWLGLFSLVLLVRAIMEDEYLLLSLLGGLRSDWYYRILYLTLHLAFPLYFAFFNNLYPSRRLRSVPWLLFGAAGILFVLTFFFHYVALFRVNQIYFFFILAGILYFLARTAFEARRKTPGAVLFGFGFLVLAGFIVHDMLAIASSWNAPRYLYFGTALFILFQAVILARGYSRALAGLRELLAAPQEMDAAFDRFSLSGREREVSKLLIEGKKYREIADGLFISIKTVKFHCANIYRKCRAGNRTEFLNSILRREV